MSYGAVGRATDDEQQLEADAREDRYKAAYAEAMLGRGPFWPQQVYSRSPHLCAMPGYDAEQDWVIFRAVRTAMSLPAASPGTRWAVVENAVKVLVDTYAQSIAK